MLREPCLDGCSTKCRLTPQRHGRASCYFGIGSRAGDGPRSCVLCAAGDLSECRRRVHPSTGLVGSTSMKCCVHDGRWLHLMRLVVACDQHLTHDFLPGNPSLSANRFVAWVDSSHPDKPVKDDRFGGAFGYAANAIAHRIWSAESNS